MSLDVVFFWLLVLALCELSLSTSTASLLGSGGVLILASCAWLTRFDLDLLAFLLAATYSSVLVCLSLVQSNLEGYPGTAALPSSRGNFFVSDALVVVAFGTVFVGSEGDVSFVSFFNDLGQGEGDWFEQVVAAFHLFFYRTASFEAVLLNLFLLLALIASLAVATSLGSGAGGLEGPALGGVSRVRLVRAFRRQVRRKNSSQIRSAKG
jgi:hypothetical protein